MEQISIEKIIKNQVFEALKFTIGFLDSHNLKWYVAYGTMLGTVRHKGFIPWDDDIDICMPRDDYKRLLSLRSEVLKEGYRIYCIEHDDDYILPFAKISYESSTIWEEKACPIIYGNYIDIFPLDYCEDLNVANYLHSRVIDTFLKYRISKLRFSCTDLWSLLRDRRIKTLLVALKSVFMTDKRRIKIKKEYSELLISIENVTPSKYLFSFCGTYMGREYVDGDIFSNLVDMSFEGLNVKIPKDYDGYLRRIYRNYMELPPIEKRVTHHKRYYVNISERLPADEIRKRIKTGKLSYNESSDGTIL